MSTIGAGRDPDDVARAATRSVGAHATSSTSKPVLRSRWVNCRSGPDDHTASTPPERNDARAALNPSASYSPLFLLCHKLLRRDGPAIGALQHGHRGRLLTSAPISRRRMVAIEFGM